MTWHPEVPATHRGRLVLTGCATAAAFALAVAGGQAQAPEGGDPTAVDLRVSFPSGLKLARTMAGTVSAASEADGPKSTPYRGEARLGIDRSEPLLSLRSTVAKIRVRGTAGEPRRFVVRFSASQLAAVRKAARRAKRRSVVLNVVLRGRPAGQERLSKANAFFRVRVP